MRVFNAHSDLFTDIHYRRREGERNVFHHHYEESFRKGNVTGSIFVVWTDEAHQHDYLGWVTGMLQSIHDEFKEAKAIKQVLTWSDYEEALKEGKIGVLLGMEGLPHLGTDLELLKKYYYEDGVRHAGLTWNEENALAKGPKFSGGLTEAGKKVVHLMQDLGMIVDVSHLNDDGFWDMMKITNGPIMASHSNARALASHKRNLKDDMLKALREVGGIVGLNAACDFISDDLKKQDLEHLVIQLEHIVSIMGIDQVGFGFDFMDFLPLEAQGTMKPPEGLTATPRDLLGEEDIPNILAMMKKRGFTEEEIRKISHENMENYIRNIIG
ncbi:MAG: membrane dipeptidase [Tissierellia bacterium]|nr:membrane dipeptidase [Tissierellia bacterium]